MNYLKTIFCFSIFSLSVLIGSDNINISQPKSSASDITADSFASNEIGKKKKGVKKKKSKKKKKKSSGVASPYRGFNGGFQRVWG